MKKIRIMTQEQLDRLVEREVKDYAEKINHDYERKILSKQIDMATLQGQINPHFLYNVLECIRGQASLYDVPEIADTTEALSKFFRYSINTKSDTVTIQEELENVKNYMRIQQFRFKNRFSLEIVYDEADEDILYAQIPKLCLQPIVENSIVHGFAHNAEDNRIRIEIIHTKKHVSIQVSDNGCGMNQKELEALKERVYGSSGPRQETGSAHSGIALFNVNRRLQLYFGEEYGIVITSIEKMGTDFEIHIPYKPGI